MKKITEIKGGITAAKGFKASGVRAGIKKFKPDMALVVSDVMATAAACFTKNSFKAAPVLLSMDNVEDGKAKAIIINSGNANACTGEQGMQDAQKMISMTAEFLNINTSDVLVSSTGIIGVELPMDKVEKGIKMTVLELTNSGGTAAATAIMTTDTFKKEIAISFTISGKKIIIGGMAKGSGMIHPNMATMLSFITTDANIEHKLLLNALKDSVSDTYNMITVDGDTSTNDMVICLANGLAENPVIDDYGDSYDIFYKGLHHVNTALAKLIIKDGEGATKFLEVEVKNAPSKEDAKIAAKSVAGSSLVKSAFFGEDANWGRIIAALGYSGADLGHKEIDIDFVSFAGRMAICRDSSGVHFNEEEAREILSCTEIKIEIDLKSGRYEAKAWGCDLSFDYVKINASYRT